MHIFQRSFYKSIANGLVLINPFHMGYHFSSIWHFRKITSQLMQIFKNIWLKVV